MSLSEVISGIIEPVFDLLPRIHHRAASNQVLVVDGVWGQPEVCERLPVLYVPALTHVEIWPTASVPLDLGLQTLRCADGVTFAINASVMVKVTDPIEVRKNVDHADWETFAAMLCRQSVQCVVTGHNYDYLYDRGEEIAGDIAYATLSHFHIELQQLVFEDFTPAKAYRIMNNEGGSNQIFT